MIGNVVLSGANGWPMLPVQTNAVHDMASPQSPRWRVNTYAGSLGFRGEMPETKIDVPDGSMVAVPLGSGSKPVMIAPETVSWNELIFELPVVFCGVTFVRYAVTCSGAKDAIS